MSETPTPLDADAPETAAPAAPADEAMLQNVARTVPGDRVFEAYWQIRGLGYTCRQAMIGAWLSLGSRQRGPVRNTQQLADLLGCHVREIQREIRDRAPLRDVAENIRARYWRDRIADVDEATYRDAIAPMSSAADKKLAYQRAGVLIGEDGGSPDAWLQLLSAAREAPTTPED